MKALLISTYGMGRQPFGLASAAAWLKRTGCEVTCVDVTRDRLEQKVAGDADLVGFYLPMHTATRLAAPVIRRVRSWNAGARICAFGLYAALNVDWLRSLGVEHVLGAEFEEDLVALAGGLKPPAAPGASVRFLVPDRTGLPGLARYATLQLPGAAPRLAGYTEATRGCKHLCRHCPIVPVYGGRFRAIPADVVLADIESQIAAGAQHITFGDPDFFNGPTHAMRIVEGLHRAHPAVTYDATIKIEHLLQYRALLPRLVATGCMFVTSAVESIDDRVLRILAKGHTRQDFIDAVAICREADLTLVPTFVAFHPWLSLDDYCELLEVIDALDLVDHVAPIQLAIRLLVPEASSLLATPEMREHIGALDPATLTYRWLHPDPRVDALHHDVNAIVGAGVEAERAAVFVRIDEIARRAAGRETPETRPARHRATVPYLNEPWYC
jgi:radical SAM superfamily enzyme YgiQ (UPF0313 family)